jgi:mannose-6-phosphate isomerase-like protein (cupin superfamily)
MAYPGKVIVCPPRGERMVFLQTVGETNGKLLQLDYYATPGGGYLGPHLHLIFEEQFEVISGIATYSINGVEKTAHPGEVVSIPAGAKHVNLWNKAGPDLLYLRQNVSPPYGVELFFETLYGCVRDGRHSTSGNELNMLQAAITVQYAKTETYDAAIPLFVQRLAIPVLAFVGGLFGYKPYYLGY